MYLLFVTLQVTAGITPQYHCHDTLLLQRISDALKKLGHEPLRGEEPVKLASQADAANLLHARHVQLNQLHVQVYTVQVNQVHVQVFSHALNTAFYPNVASQTNQ